MQLSNISRIYKQGANEEELLNKPETRLESAPEWVDKAQTAAGEVEPAATEQPAKPVQEPVDETATWLELFAQAEEAQLALEVSASESEIAFDWVEEEQPQSDAAAIKDWLHSLEEDEAQVESVPTEEAAPELPSWLQESVPASAESNEDLPEWLHNAA